MEDKKLIALTQRAIDGDIGAFEELYAQHARSILFHVRSLVANKDDASDVAQEVVLGMYKDISKLRKPEAYRAWMHRIVRTTCTDYNRKFRREAQRASQSDDEETLLALEDISTEGSPEASLMATKENSRVFSQINELGENYRETLVLRYYDELSYKEIAEVLGISVNNVKVRLHRATESLRKKVEGDLSTQSSRESTLESETRGSTMESSKKEKSKLTEQGRQESFLEADDMGIKPALAFGIAAAVPQDSVDKFASATNIRVEALAGQTAGSAAASVGLASKTVLTTILVAVVASTVVVATVVAVIVGSMGLQNSSQSTDSVAQASVESIKSSFEGTASISFTDESGGDSYLGVTSIELIQDNTDAPHVVYTVTNEQGSVVLKGEGTALTRGHELSAFVAGEYKIDFTLTDTAGAAAHVSRTFIIK